MDNNLVPTSAYDLLEPQERSAVDEYVKYAVDRQINRRLRIIDAIHEPIPSEYIRRSKDALYKPLLRAAILEKIKEISDSYDISPDRVIREHSKIAFSEITDFVKIADFGDVTVKSLADIPADKVGAIKSIETKPGTFGIAVKVTLHDKLPSLKVMGELMGLVAPDSPPVLRDYVAKKVETEVLEAVPEKAYVELLETLGTCYQS